MPEEKVVNLGGTIANFPKTPIVGGDPTLPNTGGGVPGKMSFQDLFSKSAAAVQSAQGRTPVAEMPVSSIYLGERYKSSRPYEDSEEMYAQAQSATSKIANGFVKMVGTGTTAFLSGTAGLVYGIGAAIKDQRFSSLYNNEFNQNLDSVNKRLEDITPNYYSHAEQDAEWWQPDNLLTANFFSDKLIKNFGYSLGAMAGGFAWTKVLKGIGAINGLVKTGQGLEAIEAVEQSMSAVPRVQKLAAFDNALNSLTQKYLKNPTASVLSNAERITTSVMGTMGEASIEALQNTNDFRTKAIQQYRDIHGYDPTDADLKEINNYAEKVGNFTWGMNVALLSGTNYIQLPKLIGSSRKADKALINEIAQDELTGNWSKMVYATTTGRILGKAKGVAGLLFSPTEAFEEGSQFAIQSGTADFFNRAYKNHKGTGEFISNLNETLGNVLGYGYEQALGTKEGMENILIGGLSGGLQQAGFVGTYQTPEGETKFGFGKSGELGERAERKTNTEIAIAALNESKIEAKLKDLTKFIGIGIGSQKRRQEAIAANDTLLEKDYENDFVLSYVMPRAKYGKEASVQQELSYYAAQAMTEQGFNELITDGIANSNETKEQFLNRINNLKAVSKTVADLYEQINDRYSNIVNKEGKKVYPEALIDKMVYAAAKIGNYDERIPLVNASLAAAGVNTADVLQSMIGDNEPNVEATRTALEQINNLKSPEGLDVPNAVKDKLKGDLIDVMELAERRRSFIKDYDDIKENPLKYFIESQFDKFTESEKAIVQQEELDKKKNAKVTQKEIEIGKTYSLDQPLRREDNTLQLSPKITVTSGKLGGELEVTLPNGETAYLTPDQFREFKIANEENDVPGLADLMDNVIDKVLAKKNYQDILAPEENKLEFINSLNNKELIDDIEKEFNKQSKDFFNKVKEENKVLKNKKLVAKLKNTLDNGGIPTTSNKAGSETDDRKSNESVIGSTIASQKIPGYQRSVLFGNKFQNFENKDKIYAVYITKENQAKLIPGLVEHLAQGKKSVKTDTTIAAVMVEKQDDGTLMLVGTNGKVLSPDVNPLENAVYQVMPLEELKWSEEFNNESMLRKDTTDNEEKQLKSIYAKRRERILKAGQDLIIQKFVPSYGKPMNVEGADNGTSVVAAGLISNSDITNTPLIDIPTSDTTLKKGSTQYEAPAGMVFLETPNGYTRLLNKKNSDAEAENIYNALLKLSDNIFKEGLNDEGELIIDWLRSVVHWGTPRDIAKAGKNSIWWDEDVTKPADSLRLYFGGEKVTDMSLRTTELKKNKDVIIGILKDMYNNVSKKKVDAFDDTYNELRFTKEGKIEIKKEWPNYQTYLLSSEGRNPNEIPLRTKLKPLAGADDYNRDGVYFTMIDWADHNDLTNIPGKSKLEIKINQPKKKTTTPESTVPTFNFKIESTGNTVKMEYTVDDNNKVVLEQSAINRDVVKDISEDEATLEKFKTKYNTLGLEKAADDVAAEDIILTVAEAVIQERVDANLAKEAEKQKKVSLLAGLDDWMNDKEEEAETPEEAPAPEEPKITKASVADLKNFRKNAAKNNGKYNLSARLDKMVDDFKGENWKEVEDFIKTNYPTVGAIRVKNVLQAGGQKAWGLYSKGAIYVMNNAEAGTAYHEIFHAVWDMFTTPEEKTKIMSEFRSRKGSYETVFGEKVNYSEATDDQINEQLAREWKNYKEDGILPAKPTEGRPYILKLFADLLNFIKTFFTGVKAQTNTANLFKRMGTDYYAGMYNPYAEALSYATDGIVDIDQATFGENVDPSLIGTGLTSDNVNDIMQQMTYVTLADILENGRSLMDVENIDRKKLYADLKANLDQITYGDTLAWAQDAVDSGTHSPEDVAPVVASQEALRDAIFRNWDMLVKKHEEEYLSSYSIKLDDFDEEYSRDEDNRVKDTSEYGSSEKVDTFRKAAAAVKIMLATVPILDSNGDIAVSSIGGAKLLPMSQVRTTLLNKLANSTGIDNMMERVRQLSIDRPEYGVIYSRLTRGADNTKPGNPYANLKTDGDFQLVAAFDKVFNLQNPEVKTMYILPNGDVSVGNTALATVTDQLADEMEGKIIDTIKNKGKYYKFNGKGFAKVPTQITTGSVEKGIYFLNTLGISFTTEQLDKVPHMKRKFIEATNGIKRSFDETTFMKEVNAKGLNIAGGRLRDLGEIKAMIENPDFQTTYFNNNGDQVQSYIGQNAVSNFYNFINSVKNKEDLRGTQYSYLLTDKFSQGSVIMDKIFDPKTGEKRDVVTKYMQVGYTGGIVNEVNKKSKGANKLTQSERIAEELNLNLKGYQLNLVPGDASLGWMLAMGNHLSYNDVLADSDKTRIAFTNYFLAEVDLSRDDRPIPAVKGRQNTDLRFFKGILGSELHSEVVDLAQNTEMSAQEIYDSFTNKENGTNRIDAAVNKWIEDDVTDRIENYKNQGLIKEKDNFYSVKNIEIANKKSLTLSQLRNNIKVLSINYMINNIELHKLIYSDPYQYEDELKRTKNFNSPRQYLTASKQFNAAYDKIINSDYKKGDIGYVEVNRDNLNTITLEDVTAIQDAKMYDPYKETDGGGVVTMQANRLMRKLSGNWNDSEEVQYRYDIAWEKDYKGLALSDFEKQLLEKGNPGINSAYTPLKPAVTGRKGNDKNYNDVVLDKFALYPLSFRILAQINPESNAVKLYNRMTEGKTKIDYAVYKSGRKVGAEKTIPLYKEDGSFNDKAYTAKDIIKVPFAITAIQSEVPSKDTGDVRRGSQITKLVTLDFMDSSVPLDFEPSKDFDERLQAWLALETDEEKIAASNIYALIDMNNKLLIEGTKAAYDGLLADLGYNPETGKLNLIKLSDFLHDQVVKGNTNENILRSIESLKSGKTDIEATTAYNQIRNTLYSLADRSFASPKISGGQKVQVASTLLESVRGQKEKINGKDAYTSDILKFYEDADGKRVCEIMIEKWFDSDKSDEELINELNDSDVLKGVAFRIPTQKQNSIDVFKIAKFLPKGSADTVIVPSALVAKVGSDFDIDKLSIYFKNVYMDKGQIKSIPFLGFGENAIKALGKLNINENIYSVYKKSLENGYISSMEDLISHPKNFANLVKANSAKDLSDLAKEIVVKRDGSRFDYTSVPNMLKQTYMSSLRYAFVTGKYAIGIAAQAQTNHALNQRGVVTIDPDQFVRPDDKFWIGDASVRFAKYNKLNIKGKTRALLSRIKDANGENNISDIISMFMDGYVDITKDGPWIIEMGATPTTAGTWLFLVKIGVPIKDVAYFMNQPIIVDYLKELQTKGSTYLFSKSAVNKLVQGKKYGLASASDKVTKGVIPATQYLNNMIGRDQFSPQDKAQQIFMLGEFLKYAKMAEHLFRVTQATNFDTVRINDPVIIYRMTEQIINNSPDKYGSNVIGDATTNILQNSFIGELYSKFMSIRDIYAQVLVSERDFNRRAYQNNILYKYLSLPKDKFVKIARQIINGSFDFVVQQEGYNQALVPTLVGKESSAHQFKEYVDEVLKDEEHPMYNNLIIRSFQYRGASLEGGAESVKLKGKDNKSYDQNQIIYAFQELKNHLDSEGQGDLYNGLLSVAVTQSGLNVSPLSFTQFIPYGDFERIYSDAINGMTDTTIMKYAKIKAFERNNWNNPDVASYKKAKPTKDSEGNYQYNPVGTTLTLSNKEAQAAVDRGELPRLMNVDPQSSEGRKDFIVFSWEEGTAKERADKKAENDFSYEKKALFQKVYNEYDKPLTYKAGNRTMFVYKQINAWGDGIRANEFYDHARKSNLNNGFEQVDTEVDDMSILKYFENENIEKELKQGLYGQRVSEEDMEANYEAMKAEEFGEESPEPAAFESEDEETGEEISPVEDKIVPSRKPRFETPSGKILLKDGVEYKFEDITTELLDSLGYSAKEAGKLIKELFC